MRLLAPDGDAVLLMIIFCAEREQKLLPLSCRLAEPSGHHTALPVQFFSLKRGWGRSGVTLVI
jgi:hypothetical protein